MAIAWDKLFEKDATKVIVGFLLVFVPILSYTLLFPFFQNCINLKFSMIAYVLLGILIGLGLARYLQERIFELIHQFQLYIACAIIGAMLFPLFAIGINLLLQTSQHPAQANFLKAEGYHESRFGELIEIGDLDGFFIFLQIKGETVRLSAKPDSKEAKRVEDFNYGDQVPILIHRGLLGLKWVKFAT